jgi:hypothetical protein
MATTEYLLTDGRAKVQNTTGATAIAASMSAARVARLLSVSVKFSAAPTTSENLTITKNANTGAAYDAVLLTTDPSSGSVTSLVYQPDQPLWLEPGDSIDVAYTNTDTRTVGVLITMEERL